MFLSQLFLNLRHGQALRDLRNPYDLHRTVWSGFPNLRRDPHGACQDRILFRVDTSDHGPPMVLVQSDLEPDWSPLPVGYVRGEARCKALNLQFTAEQRLRFRLRANPTRRLREASVRPDGQTVDPQFAGKRVALYREDEQIRWLLRKAETGGFRIPGEWVKANDPETNKPIELPNFRVDVLPEARVRFRGEDKAGAFHAVRFEGILVVTDPARFGATLADGLGSAKGFGFGLLSVGPA